MEPLFQFALEVAGLHVLLEVEMVGAEWLIPYIQNALCNGSIPVRKDVKTSKLQILDMKVNMYRYIPHVLLHTLACVIEKHLQTDQIWLRLL